jgi:uncharacterized protein (DUF952 family)
MTELFHLADRAEWLAAVAAGDYRVSTRGVTLEQQGFIHCSLRHQVCGVADAIFSDADDMVLLVIDSGLVAAPIRYVVPEPGAEAYPHIHGPLPVSAVTSVLPVSRDPAGRFLLPD